LNLYKQGVSDYLWKTLLVYQNDPYYKNFHLVGGTALTLQIGHRTSEDIDLFTTESLDKEKLLRDAQNIHKSAIALNDGKTIYQIYLQHKKLKIDFVQYPYKLLDPLVITDSGLHIIGKNDIAAMKMSAAGTRGNEAKDFVDLYFLLREMSINKIIDNFNKKYDTDNPLHYIRSMAYFEQVEKENWESIKMISEPLSINKVIHTLTAAVKDYEQRLLFSKQN
jgi:hypothetical protein